MSLITPDFGLLVWMTLIFGLVFFILAKWGFPAITSMVDARSTRIEESLRKAREAEESLASLSEQQEAILDRTRSEQSRLMKEGLQAREQMMSRAKEDASREAAKIMERARAEIATERENAIREIRAQVALVSVEVAEKVVRKDLDTESEQLAILDRLVDEATKSANIS